jgi:hypothetical protein
MMCVGQHQGWSRGFEHACLAYFSLQLFPKRIPFPTIACEKQPI